MARKTTAKKAAKKATPKKAAKKAAVKKATAKAPVKKSPAKKAVKKASAKKAAPGKVAEKSVAKKAAAKKTVAKTATATRSSSAGRSAGVVARHAPSRASDKEQTRPRVTAAKKAKARKNGAPGVTMDGGRYALPASVEIGLAARYKPRANEEYMGPNQLAYFRNKLRDWRDQLVEESRQTMDNLRDEVRDVGDDAERATRETENSLELRTRDRYRKLIAKIDKALRRIEDGEYGYCEETDEEIGVDRLEARPIATLSLDAQERREHLRKQMGD